MKINEIAKAATDKTKFRNISDYLNFAKNFLEYTASKLQAVIISQNENHYRFFQYGKDGGYQITRPINSSLMYDFEEFLRIEQSFIGLLGSARQLTNPNDKEKLNRTIYTLQMSIGSALDALPVGKSNTARKINGDLFENLIRLVISEIGVDCRAGVVQVPVNVRGREQFKMSYQHDLIVKESEKIKLIGSIKTSSKDRIDKIFIDKFLYNKLTGVDVPHIAIFLNDVQRKSGKQKNKYGINSTFLPGHFKGYTIKLNPLDGVYYCDIRPNMVSDEILKDHIKTLDNLLCKDVWKFYESAQQIDLPVSVG